MSYSCNRKRKDSRTVETGQNYCLCALLSEVLRILDKPPVAIATFIIGVGFIVTASTQVKICISLLEKLGIVKAGKSEAMIGNLMSVIVFLFVWIDILLLSYLKKMAMHGYRSGIQWLARLAVVLKRVHEEDVDDTQQQPPPPQQHCRHGRNH